MKLSDRIIELEIEHGGLRSAGKMLGIDSAYLSRLKGAQKENPSQDVLSKLGLRKVISYERDS